MPAYPEISGSRWSRPASRAVWSAFADPDVKRGWFGGDEYVGVKRHEDFVVGGGTIDDGRSGPDAPLSQFHATYTDIVENERIVCTGPGCGRRP